MSSVMAKRGGGDADYELSPMGESGDTRGNNVADTNEVDWQTKRSSPKCCCSDSCMNTAIPLVGNVLEWFDFSVFGYMTATLSKVFFPSSDPLAATMATFSVFAGAFFMRPVGGLIFGHIGDTIGRKRALVSSIMLMVRQPTPAASTPSGRSPRLPANQPLLWWSPSFCGVRRVMGDGCSLRHRGVRSLRFACTSLRLCPFTGRLHANRRLSRRLSLRACQATKW